jgi:putative hydrolase of the HAD superfamily
MEQTPLFKTPPRAVLLDVGFTLTFCHGGRIAALALAYGVAVEPADIEAAENVVRREMARFVWAATREQEAERPSTAGPAFFQRMLECAGAVGAPQTVERAAVAIWKAHLVRNLWSRVGDGVEPALKRLRAAGIKLAVVSNSEGTVQSMLTDVGLDGYFDAIVDSWVVGVAKPDPRIFRLALDAIATAADDAVMVGDTITTDIVGAAAAGIRAVLIDPLDLNPTATTPRARDVAAFVDRLLA